MNTIRNTGITFALTTLLMAGLQTAQAQNMRLVSYNPTFSASINTPITLGIVATDNIGSAVAWGTTSYLSDPLHMTYTPDYAGTGLPYLSNESFFDFDFTDTSNITNGVIAFNFLNSTPGATFGFSGYTPLAEFQVILDSTVPRNTLLTVSLAPLGIPPLGSAIQDEVGNNLLLPADPNAPLDPVATAYIVVNSANFWSLSLTPPATVPEPSAWISLLAGVTGICTVVRRRKSRS